ncbi:MAG TPA: hypothetical protein VFG52_09045 [Xanthomonadales bacterium]|nr:hypothetical protein [Xanthomonadales bacterium]
MKTERRNSIRALAASIALAGMASMSAQAYGPLYIFDYEAGIPFRWDVTTPVQVWTDGGNFASGTVWIWVETPETCNEENEWNCGYNEELYVEFSNEQGVARVADALASWSSVPTSTFQAEVAGNFAELGLGGADGDITGAEEEFSTNSGGETVHEVIGTYNNGGIHVLFDEDGSVMANVMGAPYGVLGIASPEFADETTGIITEGWAVIGGAMTYYNDTELQQMGGVITHELGHSINLAHTQTNGHVVFYSNQTVATTGPVDCSAHWGVGGEYQLPYPQSETPVAADMAVMYPFISHNPEAWPSPTGDEQASVNTAEDIAAISSVYPAASFASTKGTLTGSVTYPFSSDGVIGVNIVARNIDNPFEDAISVMSGDWNDGVATAAQGVGEFVLQGLTPGARYVVHVENILAGGFPTPQVALPGPTEYFNGNRESDDATSDNACDYQEIVLAAGETRSNIDIRMNGMKKTPQLVILPAPDAKNVTESGQVTGGSVVDWLGEAISWIHQAGNDHYTILPMGGITLSDNGSVIAGRAIVDGEYFPARILPGKPMEIIPTPGNNACDGGAGFYEHYAHFAISPDGNTIGGFLWNCDNVEGLDNFTASAAIWSKAKGWTILNDHFDNASSRVNALANDSTAVGWSVLETGWWEGRVWKNGQEINIKDAAGPGFIEVGEATGINSNGSVVIGVDSWDEEFNQRGYTYNTRTGVFQVLDIAEECPPWDWFCFGAKPFNPYDIADDGSLVGAIGTAGTASAMLVNDVLGTQKLVDFLKGQGVINANDLSIVSVARKISTNGKHIVGWTGVDGDYQSFKLTLDQLWVCRKGKSMQVGYPQGVVSQLKQGATLGMCEADLPLQYKSNF